MPSFISGLTHAASQGVANYGEGDLEARRMLLAQAAAQREEQRKNIATLGEAAERGVDITPSGSTSSGPPTSTTPAATPTGPTTEAGSSGNLTAPAATAADSATATDSSASSPSAAPAKPAPTRIGSLGGSDLSIPAGGLVPKPIRDSNERAKARFTRLSAFNDALKDGDPMKKSPGELQLIANDDDLTNTYAGLATGMKKAPQVPKEARIAQLRQQHPDWSLEKASRVARLEYGDSDPTIAIRERAADPAKKAAAIRARAYTYMKSPGKNLLGAPLPGMAQDEAFRRAESDYNRSQGIVEGEPVPDDTADQTEPTAGADGAGEKQPQQAASTGRHMPKDGAKPALTPSQKAKAAVDPQYKAFKISQGYQVP